MRHIFRAQKLGWAEEKEGVWFDSNTYSNHMKAGPERDFLIQDTSSMVRNTTALIMLASIQTTRCLVVMRICIDQ